MGLFYKNYTVWFILTCFPLFFPAIIPESARHYLPYTERCAGYSCAPNNPVSDEYLPRYWQGHNRRRDVTYEGTD